VIAVDHLTKRFGRFTAVDDVSFHVRMGEVFAFLGPNGSGKTTTLKSMVGLCIPTSGRVIINGQDVQKCPKEARGFVSYLPQRVVFPENLTAREVMRFYGRIRKLTSEHADEILARAHFDGFADRTVSEFSGGMIQRLGLAVLSLPDAPILLLDEPTANLDPQGVKRFREFVIAQKQEGKTIVFSTHLLDEARQLADRVGIFVGGRLVALESIQDLRSTLVVEGTIEDLYLHYVEEYEREKE